MRTDTLAIVSLSTLALIAGCLGGAPEETVAPPTTEEEAETPDFFIVTPEEGGHLHGDSVTIVIEPANAEIKPAGGPVKLNEGHFHLTLDGAADYQVVYTTSYTYTDLNPGEHAVRIELVNNDHSPKSPKVVRMVTFTIEAEHEEEGAEHEKAPMEETMMSSATEAPMMTEAPHKEEMPMLTEAPLETVAPASIAPDFTIVSPAEGSSVVGAQVYVELRPDKVKIIPAGGAVKEDEGHFHLTLDGSYDYKVVYTTSYTFTNVPYGHHTIQVELMNNDHSSRDPRLVKTVTFTTKKYNY